LIDAPIETLSDADLDALIVEAERTINRIRARQVEAVAEAEARGFFRTIGFGTVASWLRSRLRVPHASARLLARVGRSLRSMPLAAKAFAAGDIDQRRVRALAEAAEINPDEYAAGEATLVDAARDLGPREFRATVEYWKAAADQTAFSKHHDALRDRRHVSVSRTWEGMVRIDGWLDPEAGATVVSALGAYVDVAARDGSDRRTFGQVRADALTDICRFSLDHADLPTSGGMKPHLLLTIDLETLEGRSGARSDLAGAGRIPAETARRLACDAGLSRIITDAEGLPLDVGRTARTVTPAQRRALIARDGGCAASGCGMLPQWCDAHHVRHWADHGSSDLDNYLLLCRRHHRAVHEGGTAVDDLVAGRFP
jgi:hypothetical protein